MAFNLKTRGLAALAAAVVVTSGLMGAGASAATLSLNGGSAFTLGSSGAFDPRPGGAAYAALDPDAVMRSGSTVSTISGREKSRDRGLGLILDTAARITFTYLGKEASYLNIFLSLDSDRETERGFSTRTSSVGDSFTHNADAGLLYFGFGTLWRDGHKDDSRFVNSGDATRSRDIGVAFSSIFNNGKSIILGFNDISPVDADYDDMVVRVDVAPVPLPAAGLLLIGGLGVLGAASRRRRAVVAVS